MTTKITVDTHAGWPVEVIKRSRHDTPGKFSEKIIVHASTTRELYVWDDVELIIREMKRDDEHHED